MKFFITNLLFLSILLASEQLFIISGVIVNSNNSKKMYKFIDMIEKKSGYKLKPFYVNSYAQLSEELRKHPNSLAWTCGAPFVEDSIKDAQQLVAVPLFNGLPTYSSFIVTRKSEKGKKLIDFKSRIFAYSDLRSNSGFIAPSVILKQNNFDMKNFFRIKVHTEIHEKSIEAIYRGLADVAAIDEYVWKEYIKANPKFREKLHVIEKSGPFPFTPIVAGENVKKEVILKIQNALVDMDKNELKTFYNDFLMDGFVIKNSDFYAPIKENMIYIGIDL